MRSNNKIVFTIFLTIFIDMLGIGVLIPVYPLLVLPHSIFKVIPDSWSISGGFIMLGWLSAVFPLAQFIAAPILGQLSDKFGRKKVLAFSISGTALSYFIFALAIASKNIPLMFISRLLDGLSGANISVSQAVISDITAPEDRAKNFAFIGMAFGLGFILGPFIGGVLSDPHLSIWFNPATPFYFTFALSIVNVIILLKYLPETLKVSQELLLDVTRPLHNIKLAFSQPGLRSIMPPTFLFHTGFTFFTTFFAITLAKKFGFSQSNIGNFFAYTGIMIVVAQGLIVRRISNYAKDYQVLRFSMFGTAVCLLMFYLISANHYTLLYCVPPFLAISNALTMAFNSSLVTRVTPANMRGEAFGISSSVMALAQTLPAILSGYIASFGTTLPIIVGSLTIFLAGASFWLLFKPQLCYNH